MNKIDKDLLAQIADLHGVPEGSYNIRKDGESIDRASSAEIEIVSKKDKNGVDIFVKPNTKNKSVHIPVIVTKGGFSDLVYNDFYIGENSEVVIVAGCGIHNATDKNSEHSGIHNLHIGKGAKVKYIEKHLATGDGVGEKILNPVTKIMLSEGSVLEMETIQLGGVTYSNRKTNATLLKDSHLIIKEKILTTNTQYAKTVFNVNLKESNCSAEVVSRSVAKDKSKQEFVSNLIGNAECYGHVECDAILINDAKIVSVPKITANCVSANLVHEAQIGKIAGDQLTKLMTLGLTEKEAEDLIIKGYLS